MRSEEWFRVRAIRVARRGLDDVLVNDLLRCSCLGDLRCFKSLLTWWMLKRCEFLSKDVVGLPSLAAGLGVKDFRGLADRVIKFLKRKYHSLPRVGKVAFSTAVDAAVLNTALRKHGYVGIPELISTVMRKTQEVCGDGDSCVINFDEACREAGISPENAVPALAIINKLGLGLYISTMRKPKHRLPPRGIGFDSIFIIKPRIREDVINHVKTLLALT